jgi:uncharacterized protein
MKDLNIDKKIKEVADMIVEKYQPEKIILFGSYAWGKPTKDSDVDLLIVKDSGEKKVERQRNLRKLLFGNNFPPMDLLVYNPEELEKRFEIKDIFLNKVFNDGVIIYERG